MATIIKAYWIWCEFSNPDTEHLERLQDKVQVQLNSPEFKLHMTLAGPFDRIKKTSLQAISDCCKGFTPIKLKTRGYNYKQEFFKSFFIGIEKSQELINLRDTMFKLNHHKSIESFMPHISLAYGNHERKVKDNLISFLPKPVDLITLNRISIVDIHENIKMWRVMESFPLNPNLN